jgi:hypothetical protein
MLTEQTDRFSYLAKSLYGGYTRIKGEKHPLFSRTIISAYPCHGRPPSTQKFYPVVPFARPLHFLLQCHRTSDILEGINKSMNAEQPC